MIKILHYWLYYCDSDSLEELSGVISDAIVGEETVDEHPLEGLEGGQHLAIVEAGGGTDEVVSGGAHHRSTNSVGASIIVLGVLHVSPDP